MSRRGTCSRKGATFSAESRQRYALCHQDRGGHGCYITGTEPARCPGTHKAMAVEEDSLAAGAEGEKHGDGLQGAVVIRPKE